MSSKLIVEVIAVDDIENHPNADRLDIATVKGWQCVVGKDSFKAGDKGIYIPIDSIIPFELESKIFGPDAKVKLSKGRIKTIRLRKAISQGLLIPLSVAGIRSDFAVGTPVDKLLGITKYEPPTKHQNNLMGGPQKIKKKENTNFKKYTSLQNVKNYMSIFGDDEIVSVTEKIHGTNFRAGYVPTQANTLWRKICKFFGTLPKYEFVYGSHNVQLQTKQFNPGAGIATNVYLEAVLRDNLKDKLLPGEVVYGEIYGGGVQKNYSYGCKDGERKAIYFDVMVEGEYMAPDALSIWGHMNDLPIVPELYRGPYDFKKIKELLSGNSVMVPSQKIIEGGVCKPIIAGQSYSGRKVLKFINDEYLLKDNSDFH